MSKQIAVDWFSENAWELTTKLMSKEITIGRYAVLYFELHKQARKMEEEQIIEAFKHGEYPPLFVNFNAKEYYNQTYKK
jgi:hypothetical protein